MYRLLVGEITHQQQINLFEIIYAVKRKAAESYYNRHSIKIDGAPSWHALDPRIKDVVADIFFQGVHNAEGVIKAAAGGREKLKDFILKDHGYMIYESERNRIGYLG